MFASNHVHLYITIIAYDISKKIILFFIWLSLYMSYYYCLNAFIVLLFNGKLEKWQNC